jgi:hypothetical protein
MMNASFLWDHLDMYCYAEFDLTRLFHLVFVDKQLVRWIMECIDHETDDQF